MFRSMKALRSDMHKNSDTLKIILQKLDHIDEHIETLSRYTYENIVYNEAMPLLERLIAFKEYLKLGGNGNCKRYAIKQLILQHKELWQSIVDAKINPDFVQDNPHYYENSIEEIRSLVLR